MLSYKRSVQKQSSMIVMEKSASIQKYEKNVEKKIKIPQSIIV
jgi:hypothetical protein